MGMERSNARLLRCQTSSPPSGDLAMHPEAVGKVFNVGNVDEITISDLAHLIRSKTNSKSEIHYIPYDEAYDSGFEDMSRRLPDLSRIKALIGYAPKTNLESILDQIIEFESARVDREAFAAAR